MYFILFINLSQHILGCISSKLDVQKHNWGILYDHDMSWMPCTIWGTFWQALFLSCNMCLCFCLCLHVFGYLCLNDCPPDIYLLFCAGCLLSPCCFSWFLFLLSCLIFLSIFFVFVQDVLLVGLVVFFFHIIPSFLSDSTFFLTMTCK